MNKWRFSFEYKGKPFNFKMDNKLYKVQNNDLINLFYRNSSLDGKLYFSWKTNDMTKYLAHAVFDRSFGKIIKFHLNKKTIVVKLPDDLFKVFDSTQYRFQNYTIDKLYTDVALLDIKPEICINDKVDHPNTYGFVPIKFHTDYALYHTDGFGSIHNIKMKVKVNSEREALVALYNLIERDVRKKVNKKEETEELIKSIKEAAVKPTAEIEKQENSLKSNK